jgi:penicillin-binding protein 2
MRWSCCWAWGLVLAVAGMGASGAGATSATNTTRTSATVTTHSAKKTLSHARARRTVHHRRVAHTSAGTRTAARSRTRTHSTVRTTTVRRRTRGSVRRVSYRYRRHRYYQTWTTSSFAKGDIFDGDITAGEDPIVRQAAIAALGDMNGTAVVIDPSNGRILAMVNQKMALSPGGEPCSTIKLGVALAALSEGIVTRDTMVQLPGFRMNMTEALAHSNNLYFETLGRELGFERVRHYETEFGLGELAGWHIDGEQLGEYPDQPLPDAQGGVGRMCSFGEGVSLTPLQLGALVAAIANGGTLYYLQHPTTPGEVADFVPKVKRKLDIAQYIPDVEDGMAGAVEYGTARSLRSNFKEFPVFGKTGTCSNEGTRFGWFGSFSEGPQGKLVTVFLLEGGRPSFGPYAAQLTGEFYKHLWGSNYFASKGMQSDQSASTAAPEQDRAE